MLNTEVEHRRDRDCDKKSCTNCFRQELCVEFEVTFSVDIENVEITDVTCGEGGWFYYSINCKS